MKHPILDGFAFVGITLCSAIAVQSASCEKTKQAVIEGAKAGTKSAGNDEAPSLKPGPEVPVNGWTFWQYLAFSAASAASYAAARTASEKFSKKFGYRKEDKLP